MSGYTIRDVSALFDTTGQLVGFLNLRGVEQLLGAGVGPSTFGGLSDAASVDLTTDNGPLATRLASIQADIDALEAGGGGGGSGVSSFSLLTDKATADLTTINTPLATALALLATKASPTFTGTPAAPTASAGTSTTQIASTAFVAAALTNLLNGAPGALDTLNELAAALGSDANFSATVTTALGLKAPLASPTFTGSVVVPTQSQADNSTKAASTAYVDALGATKSTTGLVGVVTLTTKTLGASDIGKLLQEQSTTAHTLSIDTTANSGIAWVAGKFFFLGSVNTGAVTLTALTGVTIVNTGTKTVVQDDTPLVLQMSPTTNRWLVL